MENNQPPQASGPCQYCGRPAAAGRTHCIKCNDKIRLLPVLVGDMAVLEQLMALYGADARVIDIYRDIQGLRMQAEPCYECRHNMAAGQGVL